MKITKELLLAWGACWTDEDIVSGLARYGGEVTPRQIANDETVSLNDRLWVLCKAIWYLDETAARLFAIESAELVAHLAGDEDDQAQYLGLLNELRQIELELPTEQRDAALSAALSAAASAAASAASAAVYSAYSAAYSAADAYAYSASAAVAAARAAAYAYAPSARAYEDSLREAISRSLQWLGEEAE